MSVTTQDSSDAERKETRWYGLFSRGARDWLRHNDKVREAVRRHLPELVAHLDIQGGTDRSVRVPVRFLEHYRFTLRPPEREAGAGQGQVKPGDRLRAPADADEGQGEGHGEGSGSGDGGPRFVLELKVDDIVDWLWEELQLPNLQARTGGLVDDEYTREGWDRRGARARLDRRRTLKEAIKRRSVQRDGPPFSNEDLRFRQLVRRQRPSTQAVVFFALDVSSSMGERDRKLAKSFFFWALQGLRRQYDHIETVFIGHTIRAWEFSEEEFFQVSGQGGTVASSAFDKVWEVIQERYEPERYNLYLFYASDGENFLEDQDRALSSLGRLSEVLNFAGYLETLQGGVRDDETNTHLLFDRVARRGRPVAAYPLNREEDVWEAIRRFFHHQAQEAA